MTPTTWPSTANGAAVTLAAGADWRYFHQDPLGSVVAITNATGAVMEQLSYDAFGKRRNADGSDAAVVAASPYGMLPPINSEDRGYTGHEMLDSIGLVHMNGRVYDPVLGRFLSADPFIQAPGFTLSYNRYAYVVNNPLVLTDPSGYSWFSLPSINHWLSSLHHAAIRPTSRNLFNALHGAPGSGFIDKALIKYPWINTIGIAAASAWGGPYAGAAASAAASAYMTGLQGGSDDDMYKAGAIAFGTAMAFNKAGDLGDGWQGYAAHAVVGCASNASSSSNCARGAASAVVGKYVAVNTREWGGVGGFAAATIAGGATSAITGGKFADGAKTAAAGYLFNELLHYGSTAEAMKRSGYADGGVSTYPNDPPLESICPECNLIGMGGAVKGVYGLVENLASKTPSLIDALVNAVPVGSALKTDAAHTVGTFFREEALQSGNYSTLVGADGASRIQVILQTVGGRFEYIYQQTKIGWEMTHQFFRSTKP
jgi:RHS repeat-associated protein